ncbi:hypothetical protein [Caballeronia sp. SL2Y3]|uniref:hypothetical protein n=1 Tax=Caballeronia sp. SL2Y3 TaxID=2878151 RepID=UPI001FD5C06D|nr:hypothetical protein [Caballeronia sp. SL2Y3]
MTAMTAMRRVRLTHLVVLVATDVLFRTRATSHPAWWIPRISDTSLPLFCLSRFGCFRATAYSNSSFATQQEAFSPLQHL